MTFWGALICLAAFILLLALFIAGACRLAGIADDASDDLAHRLTDADDPYLAEMSDRVLAANTQAHREARGNILLHDRSK